MSRRCTAAKVVAVTKFDDPEFVPFQTIVCNTNALLFEG